MIFVDDRVGAIELARYINHPCDVTRLDYGDVNFMGFGPEGNIYRIAIERKTVPDLIDSMNTGRLAGSQLIGLLNEYHVVYLLIEGDWMSDDDGVIKAYVRGKWTRQEHGKRQFTYREVANFVNSLTVLCGLNPWHTKTKKDSGRWITHLHAWWQKPWEQHRAHLTFKSAPPPPRKGIARLVPPSLAQKVAKEFPGVGWDRAKELSKRFPTVQQLCLASIDDLKSVPGIGPKTAERFYHAVREE